MTKTKRSATRSQHLAEITTSGVGTVLALEAIAGTGIDSRDLGNQLRTAAEEVQSGDLGRIEGILAAQILTLNVLFVGLVQNSATGGNAEGQLRLAFKAQSQCARTAQILGELKNPMPYVKQANIGQNVQVNNGASHVEEKQIEPTKLLTETHGETLDGLGAGKTIGIDTAMATVAKFDRSKKRSRKS